MVDSSIILRMARFGGICCGLCIIFLVIFAAKSIFGNAPDRSNINTELLFDGGFFLEGPAIAPDGKVYFSDITFTMDSGMQAGRIWCYDPVSKTTKIFRSPSGMANGILFDNEGRMVVAEGADFGGRRITRTDMESGKSSIIAGLYNGKPFNSPNDLTIDLKGRIYFTDPRYVGHERIEQPAMGVYRIDKNGEITLIINTIIKPNGIAVSNDQSRLYVACFDDTGPDTEKCRGVYVFKLTAEGSATEGEKIIDVAPSFGVDGMTIDNKDNLYITSYPPNGISIFSKYGKRIGFIEVPEPPSNVTFGIFNGKPVLYITAGHGLYRAYLTDDIAR